MPRKATSTTATPPMRLILASLLPLAGAAASSVTAAGAAASVPPRTVSTRAMSLAYTASVDPTLILSHATKMRWSSARHGKGFDPTDPAMELAEERDDGLRPTLCRTLARRFGAEVFGSLVERLDGAEAWRVMAWKDAAAAGEDVEGAVDMTDLEPVCHFTEGRERRYGVKPGDDPDGEEAVPEELREIEQTCTVPFSSILPHYGIGFTLTFTLHEKPMGDLTPEQITQRITPDHRGWTQPVRTTEASMKLSVQSPDYGYGRMGLGNAPPEARRQRMQRGKRSSNVERAIDQLVARADSVLNAAESKVEKDDFGWRDVEVTPMPDHPSTARAGASASMGRHGAPAATGAARQEWGEEDSDIPQSVRDLCERNGLTRRRCREVWEITKEMEMEEPAEAKAGAGAEAEAEAEADPSAYSEPEPEPEAQHRQRRKQTRQQTVQELEDEMERFMAEEAKHQGEDGLDQLLHELELEEALGIDAEEAGAAGGIDETFDEDAMEDEIRKADAAAADAEANKRLARERMEAAKERLAGQGIGEERNKEEDSSVPVDGSLSLPTMQDEL